MAVLKKTKQRKQINDFTFNGAKSLTEGELQAAALIDFAHDGESACAAASQIHSVSTGLNCGSCFYFLTARN